MRTKSVKFEYDADVDAAYLTLKRSPIAGSEEVRPGIIIDFDKSDGIVGVEILSFTKRFKSRERLIKRTSPTPRKRRAAG